MSTPRTTALRRGPFDPEFDEFFGDVGPWSAWMVWPGFAQARAVVRACMDVVDQGPSYWIAIEMPGVRKEDIDVSVDGAQVSIRAEPVIETPVKEGEKLVHGERCAIGYARSFELPNEVTDDGAEATYENGVLLLMLPKRAAARRQLTVH